MYKVSNEDNLAYRKSVIENDDFQVSMFSVMSCPKFNMANDCTENQFSKLKRIMTCIMWEKILRHRKEHLMFSTQYDGGAM